MPEQTFPAQYKSLCEIENFILIEAQKIGFSPKELYAIELSVDEAVANIISHSYCGECDNTIAVHVETLPDALRITFSDQGNPFDPTTIPEPSINEPPEQRPEHGLGVYTMRKLMDEVTFDFSQPGINTLTMVKLKRAQR